MDIESEGGSEISKKNKAKDKTKVDNKSEKLEKDSKETKSDKKEEYNEEDEFNPTLAAMEEEIKPQVISTMNALCKNYSKLIKYQSEKLNYALSGKEFLRVKEKGYKKIQNTTIEKIKTLQLNPSVLEELVQSHYQENKKIISLEGLLMRSAIENKITREEISLVVLDDDAAGIDDFNLGYYNQISADLMQTIIKARQFFNLQKNHSSP